MCEHVIFNLYSGIHIVTITPAYIMVYFSLSPVILGTITHPTAISILSHILREEKRVPSHIPLNLRLIILLRIKLLPHARRINMFIPLIPSTIHNLRKSRIIIRTVEVGNGNCSLRGGFVVRRPREGVVVLWNLVACCWGRCGVRWCFGAVVEEEAFVWAEGFVDDEVVEVVMLYPVSFPLQQLSPPLQ